MVVYALGVQSYTFRKFKELQTLADSVKAAGLGHIELYGGHLSPDAGAEKVHAGVGVLKRAGFVIDACGIFKLTADEAATRRIFELGKAAGVRAIGGDPDPEAVPLLDRLTEEYRIPVAVHNHGRKHRYGSPEQLEALFKGASPRIGLCLDTAWLLDSGGDPVAAVGRFARRLFGVHLKDFVFGADGSRKDVILGDGGLKLAGFFDTLRAVGFNGYLTIEYEGNADNPLPELKACVARVRPFAEGRREEM
ncbi:MAG: sugar phosphate isomerase/epimerase family protein [Planctomycetota bacterium]